MSDDMILGSVFVDKNGKQVEITDEKARAAIKEIKENGVPVTPWLRGTTETITPAQVVEALDNDRNVVLECDVSEYGTLELSNFTVGKDIDAVLSWTIGSVNEMTGIFVLLGSIANGEWTYAVNQVVTPEDIEEIRTWFINAADQLDSHEQRTVELRRDVGVLQTDVALLNEEIDNQTATNSLIIAHRGYHANCPQNSFASVVAAVKEGFGAVELDIHKCKDGVYILSHDATITLYNNGAAETVTITSVNYSDIASYTLDAASNHRVCTLQSALVYLRNSGVKVVLDRKSGSNKEIMQIVSLAGMTGNVILSYGAPVSASADAALLGKYKNVPLRVIPTDYDACLSLMTELENPIFADVNASIDAHKQQYLNIALSCGIPIIFSGCTMENASVWAGVAYGCMAEGAFNIGVDEFRSILSVTGNVVCTIAADNSASVGVDEEKVLSVTSDNNTIAGYVYAYSENPDIASVSQMGFGNAASIKIKGVSDGITTVHLFTPSGAISAVDVSSGITDTSLVWRQGTVEANGHGTSVSTTRMSAVKPVGTFKTTIPEGCALPEGYDRNNMYLPTIPEGATTLTIPEHDSALSVAVALFAGNGVRIADPGYNVSPIDLTQYPEAKYYSANVKHTPDISFSLDPDDTTGGYEAYLKVKAITDFIFT